MSNNNKIFEFDIAIAFDWAYDFDFIHLMKSEAVRNGLTVLIITADNLNEVLEGIKNGSYRIQSLFDRASDTSPSFIPLQKLLVLNGCFIFDTIDRVRWASDKATMHLEFVSAGIRTPYTIILPPHSQDQNLSLSISDLAVLGRSFIIKPANTTGGGIGVVNGAETLQDVINARKHFIDDKYLLQEKIVPMEKEGKRYWFRGFYAFGQTIFTWWDIYTHIYSEMTEEENKDQQFSELHTIINKIFNICKLNFFSTEIAMTDNGEFVVVDYINEACDMRPQFRYHDGVPDILIEEIASHFVRFVINQLKYYVKL